jgi:hypothetical protein
MAFPPRIPHIIPDSPQAEMGRITAAGIITMMHRHKRRYGISALLAAMGLKHQAGSPIHKLKGKSMREY